MKHIPNLITSLNLAAGFIAILYAANGDLITSSWFVAGAMIFDFLDGFSARLLKAYSAIGRELDSLADMVSFGVAPALLIYKLIINLIPPEIRSLSISGEIIFEIIIVSPVIMPVCAALRLAKFNIDSTQKISFKGLPTPANALAVISVIIAAHYSDSGLPDALIKSPFCLSAYSIILSILMITQMPFLSLKLTDFKLKGNEGRYILTGLVLISFLLMGMAAAPLIIPFYIIASWISTLI